MLKRILTLAVLMGVILTGMFVSCSKNKSDGDVNENNPQTESEKPTLPPNPNPNPNPDPNPNPKPDPDPVPRPPIYDNIVEVDGNEILASGTRKKQNFNYGDRKEYFMYILLFNDTGAGETLEVSDYKTGEKYGKDNIITSFVTDTNGEKNVGFAVYCSFKENVKIKMSVLDKDGNTVGYQVFEVICGENNYTLNLTGYKGYKIPDLNIVEK